MDLEGEEPDTVIKRKSGKKQKKGHSMRDHINKVAAELTQSNTAGSNPDVHKRKAGPNLDAR
jgi:hypothetical protein